MVKSKQIRRALVSSLTTLVLCIAMLVGSTYAWFSNNASVAVSKIQAGSCDVVLQQQDTAGNWTDTLNWDKLSFDSNAVLTPDAPKTLTLRVANKGQLNATYKLLFTFINDPDDLASSLNVKLTTEGGGSDVTSPASADDGMTLAQIKNDTYRSVLAYGSLGACNCTNQESSQCACAASTEERTCSCSNDDNCCVSKTIEVTLRLGSSVEREGENQSLNISNLAIKLVATQADENASYQATAITEVQNSMSNVYVQKVDTAAAVYAMDGEDVEQPTVEAFDFDGVCSFRSLDDLDEENPYAGYHADVVVTADGDMAAESLLIATYSELFCDGDWLGWTNDATIEAGEELRLLYALWGEGSTASYAELFENDAKLKCAIADLGEDTGVTVRVELRLYEVEDEAETGEYLTIGSYEYTF